MKDPANFWLFWCFVIPVITVLAVVAIGIWRLLDLGGVK